MPTEVETVDWESAIADLLEKLSAVQQELLDLLLAKRERMAENDVHRITELHSREEELSDRLQACHDRRAELLALAAEHGLPSENLGKLASSLKPEKERDLASRVKDATSRMRLLHHHSLANWVLAQRTMLHLSQLLEIIASGGRLQPTYGRGDLPISSGVLVDREA
ncbi:MAG: flagellar export chaperone FlgN [Pirellulaceae bacterium]